jgi:multiple sugar transport system permease protein
MSAAATRPEAPDRPRLLARKRVRQTMLVWCFLLPSFAIFLIYRIIPLGWNFVLSFQDWSPMRPARWAGLDHYGDVLS